MYASTLLLALAASGISAQFTTTLGDADLPGLDAQSIVLEQAPSGDQTVYKVYEPTDSPLPSDYNSATYTVAVGASTLSLGADLDADSHLDVACGIEGDNAVCVDSYVGSGSTYVGTLTLAASDIEALGASGLASGVLPSASGALPFFPEAFTSTQAPETQPSVTLVPEQKAKSSGFTATVSSILALGALALPFFL